MNSRDQAIWDIISVERAEGEEVELPGWEHTLKVISNESFAIMAIREISTMKYLYNIKAPIMYCLHFGVTPSNVKEAIKLIERGLEAFGWTIKKDGTND